MFKTRNKLYAFLFTACLFAYLWLLLNKQTTNSFTVCYFKNITNLPCPSCGTTRALVSLNQGELIKSILINPLGIFAAVTITIIPIWIITDVISRKKTLFNLCNKIEASLQKPKFYIPFFILILINWIWNIKKQI